jgi:murein DD-endopeptidase MepM/ murein hydrolase activator NlpD
MLGNHVFIEHGEGEVSGLFHLRQGSVRVKAGDRVRAGQEIGRIGFSGDAITVHLHYQLMSAPDIDTEGLPSYFFDYRRILGRRTLEVARGRIDSGDIVEAIR